MTYRCKLVQLGKLVRPGALMQLACVVVLVGSSFRARADTPDDDRARSLAREGTNLFAQGDARGGEAKLEEAWALKKTADIAGNLGSVELELKEYDRAANHLSYCERHLPVSTPKEQREALHAQLAEAKTHVAALVLDVVPGGVEIDVDGENIGRAPLEGPLYVNPGSHRVIAKLDGLVTKEIAFTVIAAEEKHQALALDPVKQHTTPIVERRSPMPGAMMIGVGGAGVLVGATLLGLTVPKENDARALGRGLVCAPAQMDAGCSKLASVVSTHNAFVYGGWVTASVGVALAGAGIAYLAWPYGSERKASVTLAPSVSTESTRLTFAGTF